MYQKQFKHSSAVTVSTETAYSTTHQNTFKHLFLANLLAVSQKLAAATHRLVSHCWSKRSIKMMRC